MTLDQLGWNAHFARLFVAYESSGLVPARIAAQHRELYRVFTTDGELVAFISGRLRQFSDDLPVVGDWAAIAARPHEKRATIHHILDRRTKLARRAPGRGTHPQVLAANIDSLFIITALDHDFSIPRIERYITLAREHGVEPVIVLNKADACADADRRLRAVIRACPSVAAYVISATTHAGIDQLRPHFVPGATVAMLGSSGAGKSTLLNALLGIDVQRTTEVRTADSKGRHTTTHRQMFVLPSGALLIDTPGLREVQLWATGDALHNSFADVASLAASCRFGDCRHHSEPGCAVIAAAERGQLTDERLESFRKQQHELAYLERQTDTLAAQQYKRAMKSVMRLKKQFYKEKE